MPKKLWNWQQQGWPYFIYTVADFSDYEGQFLHNAGAMAGSIKHISGPDKEGLTVTLVSDEALKTSEIEGELLNRDSLQSSVRKHFGLKADRRKVSPAEYGVAEMMVDVYKNYAAPLTHQQLFDWHAMLMNGRRHIDVIGAYRTHSEPMQIVSGKLHDPTVHYEAPPSQRVPDEMKQFVDWFNRSENRLPELLRAGIAHLYFESIHPFEDGNGRIGRAIAEKALSQHLGRPTLIAIASTIQKSRGDYYAALQQASRSLEISQWLQYFCRLVLAAQEHSQQVIDFIISKGRFYQRFASQINERQAKVIERVFREGIDGFKGGLSADNYISITGAARATVTRDLQKLVTMGALSKTGQRKSTRYFLKLEE